MPVGGVGHESGGRRVGQMRRHDDSGRKALRLGHLRDALGGGAVRGYADAAVFGLVSRGHRRCRGAGVGDAVVGRVGFADGRVVGAVEGRRAVLVFDHVGGDLPQSHAVADHQDHVVYFFGFRSRALRRSGDAP